MKLFEDSLKEILEDLNTEEQEKKGKEEGI
jgi:hypothetical protein